MATIKKYMTPIFRVSFPSLFEPSGYDGSAPKYSVQAIWRPADFTAADKHAWSAILKGIDEVSMDKFKAPYKTMIGNRNFKAGIRNGNEKPDLVGYGEGTKFATLSTKMAPGVVNIDRSPIGPEYGNADLMYPGCYARAMVTVYAYDNKSKGIALGLMSLQRIRDGERLDSRTNAADDFADATIDEKWLDGSGDLMDDELAF